MPTSKSNWKLAEPSKVSLVEAAMRESDDFRTVNQLLTALNGTVNTNQLTASLAHLKKFKAADVIESESLLWWYLTPDTDTRTKKVEIRVAEEPGTRHRGSGTRTPASATSTARVAASKRVRDDLQTANAIAEQLRAKRKN